MGEFTREISSRDEFVPVSGQSSYVVYTTHFRRNEISSRDEISPRYEIR